MVTLDALIAGSPLGEARPEVVAPATRQVSWVHSSEIYEIAPLLSGGEVLLTTGLGLVGRDDHALGAYVDAIAERGASTLALELGRTFPALPRVLVTRARERGLGLVALHAIVPFVRIARVANELLLDHEAAGLRRAAAVAHAGSVALARRQGLGALVASLEDALGSRLRLEDLDGRAHAGALPPDRHGSTSSVVVGEVAWGRLVCEPLGEGPTEPALRTAADMVGLALLDVGATARADPHRALLLALAHGAEPDRASLRRRAEALGLRTDRPCVGLVLAPARGSGTEELARLLRTILAARGQLRLVAPTDEVVLALVDADLADREAAHDLLAEVDVAAGVAALRVRALVLGTPAARLDVAGASLTAAVDAWDAVRALPSTLRRVTLPRDVALHRLLLDADDTVLEGFVERVLGPLLALDAARDSLLLPTLDAFVRAGRSKAAAAEVLGVRRQTVHERLGRMSDALDAPLDAPDVLVTLEVALLAWRLRSAGSGARLRDAARRTAPTGDVRADHGPTRPDA